MGTAAALAVVADVALADVAAFEEFLDPATITDSSRGGGRSSSGGREMGSGSQGNAAGQGAPGTRRGRRRGRDRWRKRAWEGLEELDSETSSESSPQMKLRFSVVTKRENVQERKPGGRGGPHWNLHCKLGFFNS